MSPGSELAQTGEGRLPGMLQQVAHQVADGRSGANFPGRGPFGGQQSPVRAVGLVPLRETQSDVDEKPGTSFGAGDARIGRDGRWRGALFAEHRTVELEDIGAIWYRDPAAFDFPDTLTEAERAYAHREARLGLGGVLAALPVLWANRLSETHAIARRYRSPRTRSASTSSAGSVTVKSTPSEPR